LGQHPDRLAQQRAGVLEPAVQARLLGQVGKQRPPGGFGVQVADPAAFAVEPEQDLGHGEGDQFAVAQQGLAAASGAWRHDMIVDQHVQFGQEGVQFFRHTLILGALLSCSRHRHAPHTSFTESTI
jgi:hypothetical protein